jgi:S-phase kinase-associated protein 1
LQQVSKDGKSFHIPIEVALMSELVKCKIEEGRDENFPEILLPNVSAYILQKLIAFCEHNLQEPMNEIEKPVRSFNMADVVQEWYAGYVNLDQVVLFELILAADYMGIEPLIALTCATVASKIRGKTSEEIRETFNLVNDLTPEEEAQVREENSWCEE